MKQKISFMLVIIWMIIIFILSGMPGEESNNKSQRAITKAVEQTVSVTNGMGITDKHPSVNKMKSVTQKLNIVLRKCMHCIEFFILAIFLMNALRYSKISTKGTCLLAIILGFLYACTDEIHQLFVVGRTAKFKDILIDTAGVIIGVIVYVLLRRLYLKREKSK